MNELCACVFFFSLLLATPASLSVGFRASPSLSGSLSLCRPLPKKSTTSLHKLSLSLPQCCDAPRVSDPAPRLNAALVERNSFFPS